MAPRTERVRGTIANWNDARGFGFAQPASGGPQIFVHIRAFPRGVETPKVGDALTFEVEQTPEGKTRARFALPDAAVGATTLPPRYGTTATSILSYLPIVAFAVLYFVVQILWHPPLWIISLYVGASLLAFIVYLADKSAAAAGGWRVSESALLLLGLAGGWPGALVAQHVLHHKTRKRSFQASFLGSIVVNVLAFVILTSPALAALVKTATEAAAS